MRTAKYHDYTILRIVLFIILIILGLFVYMKFVKPTLEHVAADDAWVTVEATCTADGYRYKVCTECGEKFDRETLPATGHTLSNAVKENEKPHTKTEGGSYESVVFCKECDVEISRETVMVDGSHSVVIEECKENIVEPTCLEEGGYDFVERCKGCDYVFEDTREHFTVEATGHTAEETRENVVEATCTTDGSHDKITICSVCNEELSRESIVVTALGHTAENVVENEVDATCTTDGGFDKVEICSTCNTELSRESVVLRATGHEEDVQKENNVEPTCTEKGSYDLATYCLTCGEELSRSTIIVDERHDFDRATKQDNVVGPTCEEFGSFDIVEYCVGCNTEFSRTHELIEPVGHDYEWSLSFDNGEFGVVGNCINDGCDHDCDFDTETEYSYEIVLDEENSTPVCDDEEKIYIATIYRDGEEIATTTTTIYAPVAEHKIKLENGEIVNISDLALYDEDGRKYYNISTFGIMLVYQKAEGQTESEAMAAAWDEDGFAYGVFKCAVCDTWVAVTVYNDLAE